MAVEGTAGSGGLLPQCFQPSPCDVIVGWARQNYHHEGNQMLRTIVRDNVPRYLAARSKHDKGGVIVAILERIRKDSPSGWGLVRQHPESGRWHYIGTDKAKDKIGHALRKAARDYQREGRGVAAAPPLEEWPLTSKVSLTSCESAASDHHPLPVQVTVPSSPAVTPTVVASITGYHGDYHFHHPHHPHQHQRGHNLGYVEAPPSPVPPPHLRRSSSPDSRTFVQPVGFPPSYAQHHPHEHSSTYQHYYFPHLGGPSSRQGGHDSHGTSSTYGDDRNRDNAEERMSPPSPPASSQPQPHYVHQQQQQQDHPYESMHNNHRPHDAHHHGHDPHHHHHHRGYPYYAGAAAPYNPGPPAGPFAAHHQHHHMILEGHEEGAHNTTHGAAAAAAADKRGCTDRHPYHPPSFPHHSLQFCPPPQHDPPPPRPHRGYHHQCSAHEDAAVAYPGACHNGGGGSSAYPRSGMPTYPRIMSETSVCE